MSERQFIAKDVAWAADQLASQGGVPMLLIGARQVDGGKMSVYLIPFSEEATPKRLRKLLEAALKGLESGQLTVLEVNRDRFGNLTTAERTCRVCGCTDRDCRQCVQKTGEPCHWVEPNLCSACVDIKESTE